MNSSKLKIIYFVTSFEKIGVKNRAYDIVFCFNGTF